MEKKYTITARQIQAISQLGALTACDLFGVNTEMSYSRASGEFGQFFRDMVRCGKLKPSRVGNGKNGTRWFSVRDIIALRAEEESKATLL